MIPIMFMAEVFGPANINTNDIFLLF
jgi:hypothetical protein